MWTLIVCVNTLYDIPSKSKKRELNKKKRKAKTPTLYMCESNQPNQRNAHSINRTEHPISEDYKQSYKATGIKNK